MGKYCPQCYVGVSPDDRICGNCGAVLQEKAIEEEVIQDSKPLAKAIVITETSDHMSEEIIDGQFDSYEMEETQAEDISRQDIPRQETISNAGKILDEAPILSLGDWMLTLLLLMIPIVNIVMLIVWSADAKTNPSKRHFAWAQLIYMGIIFVLSIIFSSIFAAIIISAFNSFNY